MKEIISLPQGAIMVPPSKSLAHRAVICAALAGGESIIHGIDKSDDISATLGAMRSFGAKVRIDGDTVRITGIKIGNLPDIIDCAESGTALRFLIPVAAALGAKPLFLGRGRLLERPLGEFEELFGIIRQGNGLRLTRGLDSGKHQIDGGVSSQFISGLCLALPLCGGGEVEVTGDFESEPYVTLTQDVMREFGVNVQRDGKRFIITGTGYQSTEYSVEGDYSQAAFFLTAAALGRDIEVLGLRGNSSQGDREILNILSQCGAEITHTERGGLRVKAKSLKEARVNVADCPDLAPVVSVLLSVCGGELYGAARLRLKESDRLAAMASELSKLGADVSETQDGLCFKPVKRLHGAEVSSWNDHRIAMSMAVAACVCNGVVRLDGEEAVNKSYPGFWDAFEGGGA